MDQAELLRNVRKVFRGEVAEYAEVMNRDFLALEKEPQEDDRAEFFRSLLHTAHNLKGASVAAGAPLIEDTCHRLESVLARFRDGELDADAELFQLFFQTVDALEDASRRLVEEEDLGEGALPEILESLAARLTARKKAATKAKKAAKKPTAKARKPTAKGKRPVAKATQSAAKEQKPPEEQGSSPATTLASEASVRIAAEKLDTLLGRSGELLIVERRLLDWQEKLRDLRQLAEGCQVDFAGIKRPLAKLLTAGNGHGGRTAATLVRKRLLIVDDSITTRTFQKSTLEAAGYEVTAVVDGVEAWQLLQDRGADLIISDVEMPRMDGFTLTETIRRSGRFAKIPVILLTARESEVDKARGLEVGANSYLLKSSFEQHHLLKTIAQLL